MAQAGLLAAVAAIAGLISCFGAGSLIPLLRARAVLDRPNERSSHRLPTPRGGGIALVGAVLALWLGLTAAGRLAPSLLVVPLAAVLLGVVSWVDDLRGSSPAVRLLAQFAAVAMAMTALPDAGHVFQGRLPPAVDSVAAALLWIWFVNLFNFMDGIDGLASGEAAAIGLGLVLLVGVGGDPTIALPAAAVAGAAIGFLRWNWAPARIFLGDVGSIPLGYLLGFLLLAAAARGWWKAALILPLYFLADATITLLRRLFRGERVWRAHREHFYQRAVQKGLGHAAVSVRVSTVNLLLIGCAWAAENGHGAWALGIAATVVAMLLACLQGGSGRR